MASDYGTRSPGQVAWLVAAAALLVVLIAGGGWLAVRGLTSHPPTPRAATASGALAAAPDEIAFGAPQVRDGVPWGFDRTPDGAAAAATVAVAVTGHPQVVFDADRFAQVAAVVFTADEAQRQTRQVDAARTEFEVSGWAAQPASRRLYYFTPLAVRLAAFDPSGPSATVEVWAMTLAGVGDAGGAVFTTSTVQLTAAGYDTWTVTGLESVEGPTPMVAAPASSPGRMRALVRDAFPVLPLPVGLAR